MPAFYVDEVSNVQATTNFFTMGKYTNDRFGTSYSSGLWVTWPSAVGWFTGHTLLASRLWCGLVSWLLAMALGVWFFKRHGIDELSGLLISAFLWAVTITSPLAFPYWFGFLYNLGELNTALWIGCGLLLLTRRPYWGIFVLGAALWHGKYLYAPFIVLALCAYMITARLSFSLWMKRAALCLFVFLLPMILWIGLAYLLFGYDEIRSSAAVQWAWLQQMRDTWLAGDPDGSTLKPLTERLRSPQTEWSGFSTGTKLKNVFFSLGAVVCAAAGLIWTQVARAGISRQARWINGAAIASIGIYSSWFFFVHENMWQRHFQPALYIGLGVWIYWATMWLRRMPRAKSVLYAAAGVVLLLQLNAARHPLLMKGTSYARACDDLYGTQCDPDLYPAETRNESGQGEEGKRF